MKIYAGFLIALHMITIGIALGKDDGRDVFTSVGSFLVYLPLYIYIYNG